MKFGLGLLCCAHVISWVNAATALTLVNDDPFPHEIQIFLETGSISVPDVYSLEPAHALEEICEDGCKVFLGNGESIEAVGNEEISIFNGAFVRIE